MNVKVVTFVEIYSILNTESLCIWTTYKDDHISSPNINSVEKGTSYHFKSSGHLLYLTCGIILRGKRGRMVLKFLSFLFQIFLFHLSQIVTPLFEGI